MNKPVNNNYKNSGEDVKLYVIKVVREAGHSPITGEYYENAEKSVEVWAKNKQDAYMKSQSIVVEIQFYGLKRRTFINGEEHFDERY
jgi:hypothetical protein